MDFLELQRRRLQAILDEKPDTSEIQEPLKFHAEGDMAGDHSSRDTGVTILNQRYERKLKARRAIEKLNDGTYPFCSYCEEEIAPKRLNSVPEAIFCVRCQEMRERGEFPDTAPSFPGGFSPQPA